MQCLWLVLPDLNCLLLDFFCSGNQLVVLLSLYLCFISFLHLELYVLGDDTAMNYGYFMRTKHLCVLVQIRTKTFKKREIGTVKLSLN